MAWASGMANYIPPIALTLLYLVIVKNIFDIEDEHLTGLTERVAQNFDGEIHGHRTTFYGVCKECLENESQELKKKKTS